MKIKQKSWLGLIGLLVAIVVLAISFNFFTASNGTNHSQKQQRTSSKQVVKPEGKWSGKQVYPHKQYVGLTVTFLKNNQYRLVEVNTVSQCWTRTYYGSYQKNKNRLVFTPQKVIVKTFATVAEMKNEDASAQEEIPQAQFHKQFGNQQLSKLILKNHSIQIKHDHEKITLYAKN